MDQDKRNNPIKPNLLSILKPYFGLVFLLVILTILSNGTNLVIPKIISSAIDSYTLGTFSVRNASIEFFIACLIIFIFTYLQNIVQTYASERVARDLRQELSEKISVQDYTYVQNASVPKLLTNMTSDVDGVKTFVSMAISSIIASVFLIIGASTLMILINWRLALAVLGVLPVIAVTFYIVMGKVRKLFKKAQEAIDRLNKIINESIIGSALIRLLNSQKFEYEKFLGANTEAKEIGFRILHLFSGIIPFMIFTSNIATLAILVLGGHFIVTGTMSLGDFTAFYGYLAILVFPVIIIGFMSNVIAQASASYQRICEVLGAEEKKESGNLSSGLMGDIEVENVQVKYGEKAALDNVSFSVAAGSRTAIIGPTAGGKTQLLNVLTGLLKPGSGAVRYSSRLIEEYDKKYFHKRIGLVFQDSIIFNMSLRENIAFGKDVKESDLQKAIMAAELEEFIGSLPEKLDTVVSERGTSLSGGQKQRIMLARALTLNPKVLILDDFTARLDAATEKKILKNVRNAYPEITLISVTQKIEPVKDYDQIILLMEGEVLAIGTHDELLSGSPEYVQILNSQKSLQPL
jgi:ATP-binding cassette, subfamily B, bacterial